MTSYVLPKGRTGQTLFLSAIVAAALTFVLLSFANAFKWTIGGVETLAVFTSFMCTWLCVKQSRWNYPVGVLSTMLLAWVFWEQKLFGSAALNIYLIPTLVYGWFVWGDDKHTKPVGRVASHMWVVYVGATLVVWHLAQYIMTKMGATMPELDAAILFGSIFAQFLLDRKRIETWFFWAIVNVISIYVYFSSELYLLALQFIVFLGNTVYGYVSWSSTVGAERENG